jgi:hypothetical protein
MIEMNPASQTDEVEEAEVSAEQRIDKTPWETPCMQDVSEEVMAQPYIRFT